MRITGKTRRGFLGSMAAVATAAGLRQPALRAAAPAQGGGQQPSWLAEVKGTHRCLFDFNAHKSGFPLMHILNYLNTYNEAYGMQGGQVAAVGTFYAMGPASSIMMAFNDDMWAKYQLGEYTGLKDTSGRPYTHNVFNNMTPNDRHLLMAVVNTPDIPALGEAMPALSIASLQKMGTTFLLCNNALGAWELELAARGKGTPEALDKDLRANLLPGVITVPAMVIAIEQAQGAGMAYNKQ
jgi:intracellular sulfur oxidation DsrE/DsrF family protein